MLVLAALPSWSEAVINTGNPDAKRLYDDLLSNYNKLVRPVHNTSDPLTVRKKIYTKIHEYDIYNSKIFIHVFLSINTKTMINIMVPPYTMLCIS